MGLDGFPTRVNFVWLINKAGQLMYSRDFANPGGRAIGENEKITWASALHGLLALSKELSPVQDCGPAEVIETSEFTLHCYSTLTELRIVVSTHPQVSKVYVEGLMVELYTAYTDYVLKNPFYTVDQNGYGQTITHHMKLFHAATGTAVMNLNRKA